MNTYYVAPAFHGAPDIRVVAKFVDVDVPAGFLRFYDTEGGEVIACFAPGSWLRFMKAEKAKPE